MTTDNKIWRLGLIGNPVSHSLSPVMMRYWLQHAGLAGDYQAIAVEGASLESQLQIFNRQLYDGFNVTLPHKQAIMPLLDKLSGAAARIGSVNLVRREKAGWVGYNSDMTGFMEPLRQQPWPKDRPILLLGAGGAAPACVAGLLQEPVPLIMIANRSRDKAAALAAQLNDPRLTVLDWDDRHHALSGAGLVVNTTSLGLAGMPDLTLDMDRASPDCIAYDIIYSPAETAFLRNASARGLRTLGGLPMLVCQGAAAFKLWTGEKALIDDDFWTLLKRMVAP